MNKNDNWDFIWILLSVTLGVSIGYFLFRDVVVPSYPDRTQEVVALQTALEDTQYELGKLRQGLINTCKYTSKTNGDFVVGFGTSTKDYTVGTTTDQFDGIVLCDGPLATSTASSTN